MCLIVCHQDQPAGGFTSARSTDGSSAVFEAFNWRRYASGARPTPASRPCRDSPSVRAGPRRPIWCPRLIRQPHAGGRSIARRWRWRQSWPVDAMVSGRRWPATVTRPRIATEHREAHPTRARTMVLTDKTWVRVVYPRWFDRTWWPSSGNVGRIQHLCAIDEPTTCSFAPAVTTSSLGTRGSARKYCLNRQLWPFLLVRTRVAAG